jgi:tRNA (adenine22-N1)-methyltransferase
MIKISNRLLSLTKYVNSRDLVMDVGCDHALLDIYLVQKGIVNKLYVCDVNQNALNNGIENIKKNNLSKNIVPILGYGIERVSEVNVNTLVISGMGSKTIINILESPNLSRIYKLILQSNNNHFELREFLMKKGFTIYDEEIVKDGKKTYINIVAIRDTYPKEYSKLELEFGPILIKNKDNLEYFKNLRDDLDDLLFKNRSNETKDLISDLDIVIKNLEN